MTTLLLRTSTHHNANKHTHFRIQLDSTISSVTLPFQIASNNYYCNDLLTTLKTKLPKRGLYLTYLPLLSSRTGTIQSTNTSGERGIKGNVVFRKFRRAAALCWLVCL